LSVHIVVAFRHEGGEPAGHQAPAYPAEMTPDEVGRYAESLPQVKRKGTETRPGWYVHDRLVARLLDEDTVLIRVPLSKRERLLGAYPDSFGVPPRMESHHKVEAYLAHADPRAVFEAIDLAWEMQRAPTHLGETP
jgi:hypothetical protein